MSAVKMLWPSSKKRLAAAERLVSVPQQGFCSCLRSPFLGLSVLCSLQGSWVLGGCWGAPHTLGGRTWIRSFLGLLQEHFLGMGSLTTAFYLLWLPGWSLLGMGTVLPDPGSDARTWWCSGARQSRDVGAGAALATLRSGIAAYGG